MLIIKRILLAAITALLAINLYTGAPLLAIWVGSRVQSGSVGLTMTTVEVVLGVLIASVAVLALLLGVAQSAYRQVTGQPQPRRRATWLRSLRDERPELARRRHPLTDVEKVLVVAVAAASVAFEIWFFVLSGSPIGHS